MKAAMNMPLSALYTGVIQRPAVSEGSDKKRKK